MSWEFRTGNWLDFAEGADWSSWSPVEEIISEIRFRDEFIEFREVEDSPRYEYYLEAAGEWVDLRLEFCGPEFNNGQLVIVSSPSGTTKIRRKQKKPFVPGYFRERLDQGAVGWFDTPPDEEHWERVNVEVAE